MIDSLVAFRARKETPPAASHARPGMPVLSLIVISPRPGVFAPNFSLKIHAGPRRHTHGWGRVASQMGPPISLSWL